MAFPWAAAAGAALSVGSNALNWFSNQRNNKENRALAAQQNAYQLMLQDRQFQYNTQASQDEYNRNLEMWHMQNEYNSPSAQMQRYVEAGLNPNLIYGSGATSAGNAQTAPQYNAARYESPNVQRSTSSPSRVSFDPYQAISFENSMAIQRAQRDQISAQADYTRAQIKNAAIDNLIKVAQKTGLEFDNRFKQDTRALAYEQLRETLNNTRAKTDLLGQQFGQVFKQMELTGHQIDLVKQQLSNLRTVDDLNRFKLQLQKMGINDRDNVLLRLASRMIAEHLNLF